MAAMAASLKSFFYGKKEAPHSDSQPPQQRTGKAKGGGKRRGLIKGLPHKSARGTPLGNWLKLTSNLTYSAQTPRPDMEPNWHRANTGKKRFIAA